MGDKTETRTSNVKYQNTNIEASSLYQVLFQKSKIVYWKKNQSKIYWFCMTSLNIYIANFHLELLTTEYNWIMILTAWTVFSFWTNSYFWLFYRIRNLCDFMFTLDVAFTYSSSSFSFILLGGWIVWVLQQLVTHLMTRTFIQMKVMFQRW